MIKTLREHFPDLQWVQYNQEYILAFDKEILLKIYPQEEGVTSYFGSLEILEERGVVRYIAGVQALDLKILVSLLYDEVRDHVERLEILCNSLRENKKVYP